MVLREPNPPRKGRWRSVAGSILGTTFEHLYCTPATQLRPHHTLQRYPETAKAARYLVADPSFRITRKVRVASLQRSIIPLRHPAVPTYPAHFDISEAPSLA